MTRYLTLSLLLTAFAVTTAHAEDPIAPVTPVAPVAPTCARKVSKQVMSGGVLKTVMVDNAGCLAQWEAYREVSPGACLESGSDDDGIKTIYWGSVQQKSSVQPLYPEAARGMNLDVQCSVMIQIDLEGIPACAEAVKCPEPFENAAIKAAMASRWYPSKDGGQAIPVKFQYVYNFKIQ